MAKKDKKKSKKDPKPTDAVGAVRTAVERTFQATADGAQSTRTRAQDLVDEVAGAAGRVREMIEDMNVLEDLKGLRTEVETLRRRVAALEASPSGGAAKPQSAKPATRRRSTSKSTAGGRSSAARSSGSSRSTASKSASTRSTASKSTSSRSSAKPRSTAKRKPSTTAKASGSTRSTRSTASRSRSSSSSPKTGS
jgi:hypothetical protein